MDLYKDYLEINHDFIPVFSDEVDKREPATWKYFVPHQSMKDVVSALIKAIEGASIADRKPIWLTGSYGTGKTFASFVIKHILEDELQDIREYFDKYQLIQPLYPRLEAIRKSGRVLVVHRSSSSNITTDERLLIEIQQSIRKALENSGYSYLGGRTAFDAILNKLIDPESTFNFKAAFNKYRLDFGQYANTEQVIKDLQTTDNYGLVETIARVMEKEGFAYFESVDDVKAWIDDVIKGNSLKAIVFIWDEFTDYFRQNRAVSTLQELAQASAKMPFYLFLITHRTVEQFALDEDARRVLMDRFITIRFEMSDVTAYQLMANAINVKNSKKEEWEIKLITLWDEVYDCVKKLKRETPEGLKDGELKNLVPIHPFSAYLLSVISKRLSSNQRTMFQFLKEDPAQKDEDVKYNFNWFIQTHSLEGWHWLTADILWDYFFKDEVVDNTDYSSELRQIINYYNSNCDKLNKDEEDVQKVFKCAMLLVALNRALGGARLLKPLQSNLNLIFMGTPVYGKAASILNKLQEYGLLNFNPIPPDDREIIMPMISYDKNKWNNIREQIKSTYSFERCAETDGVLGDGFLSQYTLNGPLDIRFESKTTSLKNFKGNFVRLESQLKPYQLGLLFVIARSDDELTRIDEVIKENVNENSRTVVVSVDPVFGEKEWESWLDAMAYERYAQEIGDKSNAKYYEDKAKDYIYRWLSKVAVSHMSTCFKGENAQFSKLNGLREYLSKISAIVYPYGSERVTPNENLYKPSGYSDSAVLMGMGQKPVSGQYWAAAEALKRDGFWDNDDMFTHKPEHALSKMKQKIKDMMDANTSVYLKDIWKELMKPPFGLAPSQIAAFLLGFLMKEYAGNSGYYKDDGINTVPLSYEGLADAIVCVLKDERNADRIAIMKMKPEHEYFCRLMADAFNIDREKASSPKNVKQNIRIFLSEIKYPLWVLKYYILYSGQYESKGKLKDILVNIMEQMCEFISAGDESDEVQLVDTMVGQLKYYPDVEQAFKNMIDTLNFKDGMMLYFEKTNSDILTMAKKANIDFNQLLDKIRDAMTEDAHWLWQEEMLQQQLRRIEDEYRLLNALNDFIGIVESSLDKTASHIKELLNKLKIPSAITKMYLGEARDAFDKLMSFVYPNGRQFTENKELTLLIDKYGKHIKDVLNNQYAIFDSYLKDKLNLDIRTESTRELFDKLPQGMINYDVDAFNRKINDLLNELKISQLRHTLNEKWLQISGYPSPQQWSRNKGIPILCLKEMSNPAFWQLFKVLNNSGNYGIADIEEAIKVLEDNEELLSILRDDDRANKAFIQAVAGDYVYLVKDDINADTIKEKIKERFGDDVYAWGLRSDNVSEFVQSYLVNYYRQKAYTRVLEKIDVLTADEAKEYLKELIKNEPLVGIKILMQH